MPLPPLVVPPLLVGGPASSRLLFAASRASASGLLATCLVRALYRSAPEWLREDDSWRALIASSEADEGSGGSQDEMATLSAVLVKLQGLVATGHAVLRGGRRAGRRRRVLRHVLGGSSNARRLGDDCRSRPLTALEWNVALLAYVQLCGQMRDRHPELRDKLYSSFEADQSVQKGDGSEVEVADEGANDQAVTAADIEELRLYLEFAVWSYEPDEEKLRAFLLRGPEGREDCDASDVDRFGFRLILHRTTAYIDPLEDSAAERNVDTNKSRSSKKKVKKPPGRVGYFVAACHVRKELLIGIKGTSSLEDLLTDCCGRAVRVDLEGDPHGLNSVFYVGDERGEESRHEELIETDLNDEGSGYNTDSVDDSDLRGFELQLSNISSTDDGVEIELLESMVKEDDSEAREKHHEQKTRLAGPTRGMPKRSDSALLFPTSACRPHNSSVSQPREVKSLTQEYTETEGIEAEENLSSGKLRGAHEGILHCARQLLTEIDFLIQEYAVERGYDVVCTGHSLGAGAAALLAVLIRGRYECLTHPKAVESNEDGETMQVERIRAVTFASPPVLDGTSALNCRKYVTSVVNNSDIVTRSSLSNLDAFLTVLEAVGGRLADAGMRPSPYGDNPSDSASHQPGAITSLISLLKKLSEGADGDLLLSADQMERIRDESASDMAVEQSGVGGNYWADEFGHLLFVPGRVLLLHEPWGQSFRNSSTGADAADVHARWTDGTSDALKSFDVGARGRLVADHLTSSYQRSLSRCAEHSV